MTAEAEVLAANAAFYGAFARKDAHTMDLLWARSAPVACVHPGWNPLRGRGPVMASWHAILEGGSAPPIRCSNPSAHLIGRDAAFVICRESMPGAVLVATNVFVREGGAWKLVHHQAAPVARGAAEAETEEPGDDPADPDTDPDVDDGGDGDDDDGTPGSGGGMIN